MNVVVLAGGTSAERAVSIVSGTEVASALMSRGHKVKLLDVFLGCGDEEVQNLFSENYDLAADVRKMEEATSGIKKLEASRREFIGPNVIKVCQEADIVFMALHGANGEDGKVQAVFELFGIRYSGADYLSSAIAMNKDISKHFFRLYGVPSPKGGRIRKNDRFKSYRKFDLRLPVVVKPCCGGSSVGVAIVNSDEEYEKALREAFLLEENVIVEEYIKGREFSVGVVDGKAYPVIEIAPIKGFYDFENKYKAGSAIETCPALLSREKTEEMQRIAEEGARALGITGYCRLDFMMDEDENIFCLEANTLPGMTPTSLLPQEAEVLGISFARLCEKLLSV